MLSILRPKLTPFVPVELRPMTHLSTDIRRMNAFSNTFCRIFPTVAISI
jgi:hypothetical protein